LRLDSRDLTLKPDISPTCNRHWTFLLGGHLSTHTYSPANIQENAWQFASNGVTPKPLFMLVRLC
jgi:hypothetical protein